MIEQGLLGAGIYAFTAFCARGLDSSPAEALFVDGKCWASLDALIALNAFILVEAYLKDICLVGNGLQRAERAEEPALGPPFCQNGQHNDETDKKGDKDDRLNKNFDGSNFHILSDRFERAQPFTIGG